MTDMIDKPRADDPVWREALDWLMRVQAAPDDAGLALRRDQWLNKSDAHAEAYRKAGRVWRLTGDVAPAFSARASAPHPGDASSRPRRLFIGAALAACIALMLAPGVRRGLWSDYHTGAGETREVTLADGSAVTLGAESAIDAALSADRRAVTLLSGEAFFRVAPDSARPFTVDAGSARVTVTGTAFDVHALDAEIIVEVESGSVAVTGAQGGAQQSVILQRGERARVSRRNGAVTREAVAPLQVGLWRSGRVAVDGATIAEVAAELRRHYRGFIILRDEALAARRVTGVIDLSDPAAALDAVAQPHGGTARQLAPFVLTVQMR